MLIVHLFVSYAHVNLCHFFSSSWCRGLAAASAYGSSWTFLFTFFYYTIQAANNKGADHTDQIVYLTMFKTIGSSRLNSDKNR